MPRPPYHIVGCTGLNYDGAGYSNPDVCALAGVQPNKLYDDWAEAIADVWKLYAVKPMGLTVVSGYLKKKPQ